MMDWSTVVLWLALVCVGLPIMAAATGGYLHGPTERELQRREWPVDPWGRQMCRCSVSDSWHAHVPGSSAVIFYGPGHRRDRPDDLN